MPIQVSDYTWHQTDAKILLSLDLHCTSPKNVDIVTTNSYLKVSFLPYIFEAFLCHMINADQSTARISNGRLEFDLIKATKALWSTLCLKLSQEEMQQKRQEAQIYVEEQDGEKLKQIKEGRAERERFSVSQQITEDDKMREEHQKKIEEEKMNFLKDTDAVTNMKVKYTQENQSIRSRMNSTCSEDGSAMASEGDYDGDGEDSHYYSSTENLMISKGKVEKSESASKKQHRKVNSDRRGTFRDGRRSFDKEPQKEDRKKASGVLPVRQNGTIHVNYTKRIFPTPSRESRKEEEEKWQVEQAGISSSSDRDNTSFHTVEFYKGKAVSLFENGDYKGCVNACTEALLLNPKMASLYSNRAAANLAVNNLHHAISDCSKALELLTPPTTENSKSRLLCHIRRGTAFVGLGLYSEGLLDYRAAHKLNPEDESLLKDEQRIQAIMMASTDSGESNEEGSDTEGEG